MSEKNLGNTSAAKWTPAHDEALKKWRDAHFTAAEIAPQINREFQTGYSRNAIIGRLHRLGLTTLTVGHGPKKIGPPREYQPRPRRIVIPKFSPEEVALRCIEIAPRNLSLLDLEPNDCRYPYGDRPYMFCGHPQMEGSSYCGAHRALTINHHAGIGHASSDRQKAAVRKTLASVIILQNPAMNILDLA